MHSFDVRGADLGLTKIVVLIKLIVVHYFYFILLVFNIARQSLGILDLIQVCLISYDTSMLEKKFWLYSNITTISKSCFILM